MRVDGKNSTSAHLCTESFCLKAGEVVELKLAVEQLMAEVKMLRNMQTNTRNSHQTFRNTGALLRTSYAIYI